MPPKGFLSRSESASPDAPLVLTGPLAMASRAGEELLTDCSIACVAVAPSIGSRALVSCCPCAPKSASPLLRAMLPKGFLARPESAPPMLRPCSPSRSPSRRGRVPSCSPSAPSYVSPLLHRLCHEASCGAPLLRYRALRRCCRRCARRGLRCARRACSPAAASRWPPASSVLPEPLAGRAPSALADAQRPLREWFLGGSSVAHLLRSLMDGSCSVLAPGSVRSMVLAAHPNETGGDGVGLGTRREAEGKIRN